MALKPLNLSLGKRSRKRAAYVPPERKEAIWLMQWALMQPLVRDVILHIANEGKRSGITGNILKKMGLRKGVSDFFIPIPSKGFHGLWIELKTIDRKSKVAPEQYDWLEKMIARGYAGYVAYGWVQASQIILSYLND